MKKAETSAAPAAIGPYSQAIISGNLIYTSGQIPLVPETGIIAAEDITAQTRQAISNIETILNSAGSSLERVVKTTCFLTDLGNFAEFNKTYSEYFTGKPARSCVEVSKLPKGALVEIEAIAEIN